MLPGVAAHHVVKELGHGGSDLLHELALQIMELGRGRYRIHRGSVALVEVSTGKVHGVGALGRPQHVVEVAVERGAEATLDAAPETLHEPEAVEASVPSLEHAKLSHHVFDHGVTLDPRLEKLHHAPPQPGEHGAQVGVHGARHIALLSTPRPVGAWLLRARSAHLCRTPRQCPRRARYRARRRGRGAGDPRACRRRSVARGVANKRQERAKAGATSCFRARETVGGRTSFRRLPPGVAPAAAPRRPLRTHGAGGGRGAGGGGEAGGGRSGGAQGLRARTVRLPP